MERNRDDELKNNMCCLQINVEFAEIQKYQLPKNPRLDMVTRRHSLVPAFCFRGTVSNFDSLHVPESNSGPTFSLDPFLNSVALNSAPHFAFNFDTATGYCCDLYEAGVVVQVSINTGTKWKTNISRYKIYTRLFECNAVPKCQVNCISSLSSTNIQRNGFVECRSEECGSMEECAVMMPREGCCARCKGCWYNGTEHASHTEWAGADARLYRCEAGVVTVSRPECYTPCSRPTHIRHSHYDCPVCDGECLPSVVRFRCSRFLLLYISDIHMAANFMRR
ncbi:hypothetical protein EVAR_18975_1 [Eumeta japonica]|uniref:Uncharacterized protein n=1 Tax=Eumeta variegata TaxID=151549 RepID=A0A4C1X028_EUMVA|nr:hypothetical protein EVAR_18975_1 [Eumeta japonica]